MCESELLVLAVACPLALAAAPAGHRPLKDRWVFVMRDLTQPEGLDRTISLVPRAAASGCPACAAVAGPAHSLLGRCEFGT